MTRTQKLAHLRRAIKLLMAADAELKKITGDTNLYIVPDVKYYRLQIQELVTCDHGQAGLNALARMVEEGISK